MAIGLAETWQSPLWDPPELSTFPFSIHRPHRKYSGGLSLYSRAAIKERADLYGNCTDCLFAEIPGPSNIGNVLYGIFYHRAADSNCLNTIITAIQRAVATGNTLIIAGDFNAHHTDWQSNAINDSAGDALSHCILSQQLTIINNIFHDSKDKPTHRNRNNNNGDPVIDIALTNTPNIITNCTIGNRNLPLISDHQPIIITGLARTEPEPIRQKRYVWNMEAADWNKYRNYINKHYSNTNKEIDNITTNGGNNHQTTMEKIWIASSD